MHACIACASIECRTVDSTSQIPIIEQSDGGTSKVNGNAQTKYDVRWEKIEKDGENRCLCKTVKSVQFYGLLDSYIARKTVF